MKTDTIQLPLHRKQLQVFQDPAQVILICAGRGFGKSVFALSRAIAFCLSYDRPINPVSPQVAMVCMPTLKMARAIHWIPLLNLLEGLPVVKNVDKSNFRISFHGEKPDLILRGADRAGDRLRGLNLVLAILDEFQDFDPMVWGKVVQPALIRNKDWRAIIIGTPKGKASHFYKTAQLSQDTDGWSYYHFVTADNPFISRRAIAKAKAELPPKVYRQEYEASWEDFDGQLLPNVTDRLKVSGDHNFKAIVMGGDWGDVNPALVVIGVTRKDEYILLDYWQNRSGVPQTAVEVQQQAQRLCETYQVNRVFMPDDRPSSVLSFRQWGASYEVPGMMRTVQVNRNKPGVIERAVIADTLAFQERLLFADHCHELIPIFMSYHRDKDGAGMILNRPAKNQDDHAIDATLYALGRLNPSLFGKSS